MFLAQASCTDTAICSYFLDRTGNLTLARALDTLLAPWPSILLIVVLAVVLRGIALRLISRFARRAVDGRAMNSLRSLSRRVGPVEDASSLAQVPVSLRKEQRIRALVDVSASIVTVLVWSIAVMMVLGEFGLNLGPMIASAGIVGVALGFGAQDLVKDFLSGLFMLAEDQYGVGDTIDVGEATGIVEEISLRTTKIRSVDGTLWHVPNGEIRRVGNQSQEWARALLDIGVSYDTDIAQASAVIQKVADTMAAEDAYVPLFLDAPAVWGVQDLGPDSIVLRLVIKTTPGDQFRIARELRFRLKAAFDAAGIGMPFPQRTVWFRTDGTEGPANPA